MANITKEQVLDALKHIIEPDLKKDIVSLNLVSDITINEKDITFKLKISNPAMHNRKRMEEACAFNIERLLVKILKFRLKFREYPLKSLTLIYVKYYLVLKTLLLLLLVKEV